MQSFSLKAKTSASSYSIFLVQNLDPETYSKKNADMFRLHELKLEGSQIQITDAPSS
jgi:hypothetical protein